MSIHEGLALYGAGLLTFASPCVLPLLPVYLALLGGDAASGGDRASRFRLARAGLGFALGLSLVFVLLGVGASWIAAPLLAHRRALLVVAGAAMALFGLQLLGVLRVRALQAERRPLLERVPTPGGFGGGVLFGAAFAIGWTPCVGPVLGAALTYAASTSANAWIAGAQLGVYAAGLATPLVAAALLASRVVPRLRKLARVGVGLQRGMGLAMIGLGALLATDRLGALVPSTTPTTSSDTATSAASAAAGCDGSPSAVACATHIEDAPPSEAALAGAPRLVEFVSDHCAVCARMAPLVASIASRCAATGSVLRVRVDDEAGRRLASRYGVRVVPTFVSVDASGAEVERMVGEQSSERLSRALGEVRGAACD